MSPPLLSEYKRIFVLKRICQNALGGLRVVAIPCLLIFIQLILFFFVYIVYFIFYAIFAPTYEICKFIGFPITLILLDFALFLFIGFITRLIKNTSRISPTSSTLENEVETENVRNYLAEEDTVLNKGLTASSTWSFIASNHQFSSSYIFACILSSISLILISPIFFITETSIILQIFSIFTLCLARFSSVFNSPPEIATFDPNQRKILCYRPFYVLLIGISYLFTSRFWTLEIDPVPFLIALVILPFGWFLGIFSPFSALLPWLIETSLELLGGCPSYYYFGSFVGLLLSIVYSLLIFIVGTNEIVGIILQCAFGYFLGLDTSSLLSLSCPSLGTLRFRTNGRQLGNLLLLILSCFATMCSGITLKTNDLRLSMIGTCLISIIALFVWRSFLSISSRSSNKILIIHFILLKSITIFLHVWITAELLKNDDTPNENTTYVRHLEALLATSLNIKAFSDALKNPRGTVIDVLVATLIRQKLAKITDFPNRIQFSKFLFLVSLGRNIGIRILKKFLCIIRITIANFSGPLLTNKRLIGGISLLMSPVSGLCWILSSLAEGLPLMSIFTLPIFMLSFPRPISFWKTKWFPEKRKEIVDTGRWDEAMYVSIGPSIARAFIKRTVSTGIHLACRDSFVARYEDRLLFLRILGVGWNFAYVNVKGLELQDQTSCHHQEASWIDEIFENDKSEYICQKGFYFNYFSIQKWLTILNPMLKVRIAGYEESKSTVNPLRTIPEKKLLKQFFFKAFSYLWIKEKPAFKGEAYMHGTSGITETNLMTNEQSSKNGSAKSSASTKNETSELRTSSPIFLTEDHVTIDKDEDPSVKREAGWESFWIKKCIGEAIPSNAIKERMVKLTANIWSIIYGETDFEQDISLHTFFNENFLHEESLNLKILDGCNVVEITIKAFRYATKLTLDEMYLSGLGNEAHSKYVLQNGNCSTTPLSCSSTLEETFAELYNYDRDYKFCTPNEISAIIRSSAETGKERRTLISIVPNNDNSSQIESSKLFIFQYKSLSQQNTGGLKFHFGKLDQSVVESIWSNLNFELLYLTSDDDERYSIQQDRYILRNLLTEVADSPLGYPLYDEVFRVDLFRNFKTERL